MAATGGTEGLAGETLLGIPVVVTPANKVTHTELAMEVRRQYSTVRAGSGTAGESSVKQTVRRALEMAANLSIDAHPLHLPLSRIVQPRSARARWAEAEEGLHEYAIPAAKQALAEAGVTPGKIDAVVFETSTMLGMPSPGHQLWPALGLRSDAELLSVWGTGCTGGGHAIARARDYVLAHPQAIVLIVCVDMASPHFHVEAELRGPALVGSIVSAALFSDAAGAAVMGARLPTPGYRILDTATWRVPGTADAIAWHFDADGAPRFRLTPAAVRSVPAIVPALQGLLARYGWRAADLAACTAHTGGDRIIADLQTHLGLRDDQLAATRANLRLGNLMSVAVLGVLAHASRSAGLSQGAPGIGAGFGPGFSAEAFAWTYHDGRTA